MKSSRTHDILKMRWNNILRSFRIFLTMLAIPALAGTPGQDSAPSVPESPVALAASGLAGDRIGLFVPDSLDASHLPPSLALIDKPVISAPLTAGWRVSPTFARAGNQFLARVRAPDGTDLYGGGEVTGTLRRYETSIALWNTDNYMRQYP